MKREVVQCGVLSTGTKSEVTSDMQSIRGIPAQRYAAEMRSEFQLSHRVGNVDEDVRYVALLWSLGIPPPG